MYTAIADLLLKDGKADEAEKVIRAGTERCMWAFVDQMMSLPPQDRPIIAAALQGLGHLMAHRLTEEDKVYYEMAVNAGREILAPTHEASNTRWAITINSSGKWDVTPCNDDGGLELKELLRMVDGDIEIIGTTIYSDIDEGDGVMMIIHEDGEEKDLPVNPTATKIARIFDRDTIRGNAVLMVSYGEELKGFSEAATKEITSRLASQKGGKTDAEYISDRKDQEG